MFSKKRHGISYDHQIIPFIVNEFFQSSHLECINFAVETGVNVAVEFWIQSITSINEITNDFEVNFINLQLICVK